MPLLKVMSARLMQVMANDDGTFDLLMADDDDLEARNGQPDAGDAGPIDGEEGVTQEFIQPHAMDDCARAVPPPHRVTVMDRLRAQGWR